MKTAFVSLAVLTLAACGSEPVNPPTEPAQPITPREAPEATSADVPGTGAASFIGEWAGDVSWCAAPMGERRPINITATRFEGYENSCDIIAVDEVDGGYNARLTCVAEGRTTAQRVRMTVSSQTLNLIYPDRSPTPVVLTKCTTLGDTSDKPPSLMPGS